MLKIPAGTIFKHNLISIIQPPRLILVGDSNLMLGIRSDMINEYTDYYPVNMSLNVSRGLEFMLEETKPYINSGDIILISITYAHFREDKTSYRLLDVIANRPRNMSYITSISSLISLIPEAIQYNSREVLNSIFSRDITPSAIYSPSAFNIYGDIIAHKDSIYIHSDEFSIRMIRYQEGYPKYAIELLNGYNNFCINRGAVVLFSYPPIPDYIMSDINNFLKINTLAARLSEELDLVILNDPLSMTFESNRFFDTAYHLTWEGSIERTKRLIQEIKVLNFNHM